MMLSLVQCQLSSFSTQIPIFQYTSGPLHWEMENAESAGTFQWMILTMCLFLYHFPVLIPNHFQFPRGYLRYLICK
jgi:hypothetical protein